MPRMAKTLQQHLLQGTQPQGATVTASPFAAGRPKMPKDLSPVAQAEWKRIVGQLKKRGTLTKVDASAIEVYARTFAQWRAFCEEVETRGPMIDEPIVNKDGDVTGTRRVQNPAAKLAVQLGNALRQYQKEFSATPASRERAKPAAKIRPPKVDPTFEEQFFGAVDGKARGLQQ